VDFDPSRLRRGELIAGGGAVVLLVATFLMPWYGVSGTFAPTLASLHQPTTVDGWNGLENVRWLVLVTALAALLLVWLQVTRRAPALPASFSTVVTVLGTLTSLALLYRVLINVPGPNNLIDRKAGGFVGLVASLALAYGGYASLRREGLAADDARTEIETVSLGERPAGDPAPNS
jgi:hypothetical protein